MRGGLVRENKGACLSRSDKELSAQRRRDKVPDPTLNPQASCRSEMAFWFHNLRTLKAAGPTRTRSTAVTDSRGASKSPGSHGKNKALWLREEQGWRATFNPQQAAAELSGFKLGLNIEEERLLTMQLKPSLFLATGTYSEGGNRSGQ